METDLDKQKQAMEIFVSDPNTGTTNVTGRTLFDATKVSLLSNDLNVRQHPRKLRPRKDRLLHPCYSSLWMLTPEASCRCALHTCLFSLSLFVLVLVLLLRASVPWGPLARCHIPLHYQLSCQLRREASDGARCIQPSRTLTAHAELSTD